MWRNLKAIMKRLNGHTLKYSSRSVIVTSSKELAYEVFAAAKRNHASTTRIYELAGEFTEVEKYGRRKR